MRDKLSALFNYSFNTKPISQALSEVDTMGQINTTNLFRIMGILCEEIELLQNQVTKLYDRVEEGTNNPVQSGKRGLSDDLRYVGDGKSGGVSDSRTGHSKV